MTTEDLQTLRECRDKLRQARELVASAEDQMMFLMVSQTGNLDDAIESIHLVIKEIGKKLGVDKEKNHG